MLRLGASPRRADEPELVRRAVARAKEGDVSALHFLYVRFADDVCSYVRGIVRDPHEAEDVTQNVFAKLMTAIQRYEERDVPFAAWIITVARNLALDHVRARRQIPVEEVRTSDEGHEQTGFERSQCLREALAGAPRRAARGARPAPHRGLSPREIADRLGKSEGSIHGLHHRGRGALQGRAARARTPRRSTALAAALRRIADQAALPRTGVASALRALRRLVPSAAIRAATRRSPGRPSGTGPRARPAAPAARAGAATPASASSQRVVESTSSSTLEVVLGGRGRSAAPAARAAGVGRSAR